MGARGTPQGHVSGTLSGACGRGGSWFQPSVAIWVLTA